MKRWPSFTSRSPYTTNARFDDIPWKALNTRLETAETAIEAVPIPELKQVVGMLAMQLCSLTSKNEATLGRVKGDFSQLLDNMAACKGWSSELTPDIATFADDLRDIVTKLEKIRSRGWFSRIFSKDDGLTSMQHELFRWTMRFSEMHHKVKKFEDVVDKLVRAPARHDSGWRSGDTGCHDGTRVTLLDEIDRWATGVEHIPPVFWLNGLAGTGKSAIAYTVAEHCQKNQQLGASFFFSRSKSQCTDPLLFFSTIAHQLAGYDSRFKTSLAKAIMETNRPEEASIRIQFYNFIIAPLLSLGDQRVPIVVVVDALDECNSRPGITEILQLIAENTHRVPSLRFLMTSRPETHIRDAFSSSVTPMSQLVVLHEIEKQIVRSDIELFLKSKLPSIGPSSPWPTTGEISRLVDYAAGFFIYAATAVKFLEGGKDKAQSRLDILLKEREPRFDSPYADLDTLYLQILRDALPQNARNDLKRLFRHVVDSIALLFDPIPLPALEKLFNLEEGDAKTALVGLHSVVIVPVSNSEVARTWHPSFHDFLIDDQRCIDADGKPDARFYVNPSEHHRRIAISCLQLLMTSLRKDLCNIQDYSKLNSEVKDLHERIKVNIPPQLRYSCMHWTSHVLRTEPTDQLMTLLSEFFDEYFLYWLEALSLINKLEIAAKDLPGIRRWHDVTDRLSSLIYDAQRFTLSFYDAISSSALHIYQSALLFTPKDTTLFETYRDKTETTINIAGGVEKHWNPCLRVLEHSNEVLAVASSPDSLRLASGSGDNMVRVWDREAGTLIAELQGHSGAVNTVAFLEDQHGTQIASGSSDGSIRIWDAATYTCTATLQGHSKDVKSIAFFHSDGRLVSGSQDTTIRIWLPPREDAVRVLKDHVLGVTGVACCPNSRFIASASQDNTVRIWDAHTGHPANTWSVDEEVYCVAFSPDGAHIAAGSRDHRVHIWDVETYASIATLDGGTHFVYSIAFSRDGSQLVTGSFDSIVQVWNVKKKKLISTLSGHSDPVVSVALSRHASFVLSGSFDKSVRIWDLTTTSIRTTANGNGHTSMINSIAFSPDGKHIVTTSDDSTARIWNHEMHDPLTILRHKDLVLDAKYFPDGSRIITGSHDQTVGIWEANGTAIRLLRGHTDSIRCISASPSGNFVAAGSADKTARFWDATTHTFVFELRAHLDWVTAVAFSPDDRLIATGSNDCKIRIWDLSSGVGLKVLDGHPNDPFVDVAFSSNSTRIISRSSLHELLAWDVGSYQIGPTPASHEAGMLITNLVGAYLENIVVENRGWIIVKQEGVSKRVCWIPPTWRGLRTIAFHSSKLAIGSGMGQVAMLDIR